MNIYISLLLDVISKLYLETQRKCLMLNLENQNQKKVGAILCSVYGSLTQAVIQKRKPNNKIKNNFDT